LPPFTFTNDPSRREIVSGILHDLKPFKFTPGRKFDGFGHLGDTVFAGIDGKKMRLYFDVILKCLLNGYVVGPLLKLCVSIQDGYAKNKNVFKWEID
jgi:hypothetical protein